MRQAAITLFQSASRQVAHRACVRSPTSAVESVRTFSASSSVFKKARSARRQVVEEAFEEDEDAMEEADEEEDLFGSAEEADSGLSPSDRSARRTEMIRKIITTSRLGVHERKQQAPQIRKGTLRKVVQLSRTTSDEQAAGGASEDLEGLKHVLRAWRVLGKNVTEMASNEIIAQCCKAGRPDLAVELAEDSIQYGLPPLSMTAQIRLYRALLDAPEVPARLPSLLDAEEVSPTLAVLRMALLAKVAAATPSSSSSSPAAGLPGSANDEYKQLYDSLDASLHASQRDREYAADAMKMLQAAGPQWAKAGQRLQDAQAS